MINFANSKTTIDNHKERNIIGVKIILHIIVKEFERWQYYLIALAWLLLMIFFTYTAILSSSMIVGTSFESVHGSNQCSLVSLIVNCGLLFMVIFDYILARKKNVPISVVWGLLVGIFFAICVYGLTGILIANKTPEYKAPLNWTPLARWMHLFFLFTLLWLKERAVELDMSEVEYVDEYMNE